MLKVQVIRGLSRPDVLDGSTVIIEDEYGNPLVLVQELASGLTSIHTVEDEDFQQALVALGFNKLITKEMAPLEFQPPEGARRLHPNEIGGFVNAAKKKAQS